MRDYVNTRVEKGRSAMQQEYDEKIEDLREQVQEILDEEEEKKEDTLKRYEEAIIEEMKKRKREKSDFMIDMSGITQKISVLEVRAKEGED